MGAITVGKKRIIYASAAVLAVITLYISFSTGIIQRQLNDWKLLPQPERLTELYYQDHAKLSTTYLPTIQQQFVFVARNIEYRTTRYEYTVVQQSEDGSQTKKLADGTFTLAHDARKSIIVPYVPDDFGKRVKILTSISIRSSDTGAVRSIHHWQSRI